MCSFVDADTLCSNSNNIIFFFNIQIHKKINISYKTALSFFMVGLFPNESKQAGNNYFYGHSLYIILHNVLRCNLWQTDLGWLGSQVYSYLLNVVVYSGHLSEGRNDLDLPMGCTWWGWWPWPTCGMYLMRVMALTYLWDVLDEGDGLDLPVEYTWWEWRPWHTYGI